MINLVDVQSQHFSEDYQKLLDNARLALFDKPGGSVITTLHDPHTSKEALVGPDGRLVRAKLALVLLDQATGAAAQLPPVSPGRFTGFHQTGAGKRTKRGNR